MSRAFEWIIDIEICYIWPFIRIPTLENSSSFLQSLWAYPGSHRAIRTMIANIFVHVLVHGMCHRNIPLSPTCLRLCLHLHHATDFWACFSFFVGALERSNTDVKYEESSNYTQVSFVFGCNLVFCEEKSCTFVLRYLKKWHGNLAEVKDSLKSPCWQIRFLVITEVS